MSKLPSYLTFVIQGNLFSEAAKFSSALEKRNKAILVPGNVNVKGRAISVCQSFLHI
jgi:hypothetical protein